MLPPGFVGANPDKFKSYYPYDPAKAKKLMADSGFPDGNGFPKLTLWVRDPSAAVSALAQAIQKQLQDNLGIQLEVRPADYKTFTENLKHEAPPYIVPYGMDYMDQSNLLGIWKSDGRHPWANADFDKKVADASSFVGSQADRDAMFLDAEKMLLDDMAAIFLFHPLTIWLYPASVKGGILQNNKAGFIAGPDGYLGNIYFAK